MEPSKGMLEVAQKKNIYKNYYLEGLYKDKTTSLEEGTYDVVTEAGALGEGHIPAEGLREFARLTKSGGNVILVMREEYLEYTTEYAGKLEPLMQQMVQEGIWTQKLRLQIPNYSFNKTGIVFIFTKN
jgi:ubiquinone/menaquinone biosynthesis C-methylase UbiE